MTPAIQARDLTMTYRPQAGPVTVFENLNFTIPPGQRVALVGPSGAGKSTILHLIGGLDRPSAGTIHLHGRDLTTLNDRQLADLRNRDIGFVWQAASLLPEFTAIENVAMPLLIRGTNPNEATEHAQRQLKDVGLAPRQHHRAGELSGGEQQRVAVARALVTQPKFLFADEPTGSLDYRTGNQMIDLLAELHQKHGLTSVYVTHNDHFAQRCDRILELDQGILRDIPRHTA
jgi:lipoprotein-releasing system ATP-binding protein